MTTILRGFRIGRLRDGPLLQYARQRYSGMEGPAWRDMCATYGYQGKPKIFLARVPTADKAVACPITTSHRPSSDSEQEFERMLSG